LKHLGARKGGGFFWSTLSGTYNFVATAVKKIKSNFRKEKAEKSVSPATQSSGLKTYSSISFCLNL